MYQSRFTTSLPGITAMGFGLALTATAALSDPVTALPADSFVDSIGICTHLGYSSGPYGRVEEVVKPKLAELGIRHIRDGFVGVTAGGDANVTRRMNDLASLGYRFTLTLNQPMEKVEGYLKGVGGALEAVEGPNETDLTQFKFEYKGMKFPEGTRAYQEDIYNMVKNHADPKVRSIQVIQTSMGWGGNAKKLGNLSAFADLANTHAYTEDGDTQGNALTNWHMPHARLITPGKPLWCTETGKSKNGVGIDNQNKIVPRILAEHFRRGIVRTFLYELMDSENSGGTAHGGYGLVDFWGTPRITFYSMKNLIALLKDAGPEFKPSALDYSLTGTDPATFKNIHSFLLQKRDGRFYLVIWHEAKVWNSKEKKPIVNEPVAVTLKLNNAVAQARIFSQNAVEPLETKERPSELILQVPDSLLFVELTPQM